MTIDQNPDSDSGERIIMLDVLRGLALMGILVMNINAFALPEMAYFNPAIAGGNSAADMLSWTISFILFDGKMRGLFSLLFGASMMLIISRARKNGGGAARVHFPRMFWLGLFGLAHFYLIWRGDILFLYALAGSIAFAFSSLQPHRLITLAVVITTAGCIILTSSFWGLFWLQEMALAPGAALDTLVEYDNVIAALRGGGDEEIELYRSGYQAILHHRLTDGLWTPLNIFALNIFETLPLMLIGMALMKNGWIVGNDGPASYRISAICGIGIGVAGYGALAVMARNSGYDPILMMNIGLAWTMPFRLLMTLGYLALAITVIRIFLARGGMPAKFMHRIAGAGRTAFTNYIGISLIMTCIFYGYGFGLFGQVDRSMLWLYVAGGCVTMLLWPKFWLSRFRYGPLEWLWRSLSRERFEPFSHGRA